MEITSYTSNVQPYGLQSGTKFASENEGAKSVSNSREVKDSGQLSEKMAKQQEQAVEAAVQLAKERTQLNDEQRAKMVEMMDDFVTSFNKGLSFRVDQESGRDVVTIYEAKTGDVIRQIPEEEMLEVLRRLARDKDHKSGLLTAQA
jgi:flagellar protein FlaG